MRTESVARLRFSGIWNAKSAGHLRLPKLRTPGGACVDFTPASGWHALNVDASYSRTYQAKCGVPDLRRHASHLAILAFTYREFEPSGWDVCAIAYGWVSRPKAVRLLNQAGARGLSLKVTQIYPRAQFLKRRLRWRALDLHPVDLCQLMLGLCD